jgi:transcriptional regulator with XRE-family HTH domain
MMQKEMSTTEKEIRDLLGQNLKRLRKRAQVSQLTLAGEANLTHTFINNIEHGKKWPSCRTLARLCRALKAEPYEFFFQFSSSDAENLKILGNYVDYFSETISKGLADFKKYFLSEE